MQKILLASNNKHKAKEFKQIFEKEKIELEILLPSDLHLSGFDVEETGLTFEENAVIKAKAFFEAAGMPVIADDSGLEVDALDLKPGVLSARYAGIHGDDAANRTKVLAELRNTDVQHRLARFRCVICYYDGKDTVIASGSVEGLIGSSEKGSGGFGYDPIFIPVGYEQTFAEMNQDEKNKISHRGRAIEDFIRKYKVFSS
ncbi:MAG: RdgB/HAM1 family non-canonical purine NTP pyrophosphatase [Candidatus Kapabacteria bacterium]|nr:RdgB/HAM1 family non-canonical purine NTP pyrophosphatase [Candidatus Kapabacteria bacterium]